jgi:hypothetical protein
VLSTGACKLQPSRMDKNVAVSDQSIEMFFGNDTEEQASLCGKDVCPCQNRTSTCEEDVKSGVDGIGGFYFK